MLLLILVILGDTSESSAISSVAENCDVLVHEATNEDELQENTVKNGHSTPSTSPNFLLWDMTKIKLCCIAMAGVFATKVKASTLILTHFSQRYRPSTSSTVVSTGVTLL